MLYGIFALASSQECLNKKYLDLWLFIIADCVESKNAIVFTVLIN